MVYSPHHTMHLDDFHSSLCNIKQLHAMLRVGHSAGCPLVSIIVGVRTASAVMITTYSHKYGYHTERQHVSYSLLFIQVQPHPTFHEMTRGRNIYLILSHISMVRWIIATDSAWRFLHQVW
jgi:hypothetical protein